jgi:hypothetical protein
MTATTATTASATPQATERAKAEPIVITAPKGGTQTVAPRKGAIAKAIKASGKTLNAISREHGLNPSQMRRLAADSVAKVDLPRAEAIAAALGKPLADLFGAPEAKAKATAPKATAPKATAPKATAPKATAPKATARRTRAATA